jgi:hypothetical protein
MHLGQLGQILVDIGQEDTPLFGGKETREESLFIDLETGTVIRGETTGTLPPGRAMTIVGFLAGAEHPVPMHDVARTLYPKTPLERSSSSVRPTIGKLNKRAEDQGLPRPVRFSDRAKGYVFSEPWEAIGIRRQFDPEAVETQGSHASG